MIDGCLYVIDVDGFHVGQIIAARAFPRACGGILNR
jgi:hypothetical protein